MCNCLLFNLSRQVTCKSLFSHAQRIAACFCFFGFFPPSQLYFGLLRLCELVRCLVPPSAANLSNLPVFNVSCERLHNPGGLLVVVVEGFSFFQTHKIKKILCECTRGLHFCFTPSLSQSAPSPPLSLKTKSVIAFHSFESIVEIFFSLVMFILYMITCTEDLKLFYRHRGNTFKMHFSLSLFF